MSNPFLGKDHESADVRFRLVRSNTRPSATRGPFSQLSPAAVKVAQEWWDDAAATVKAHDDRAAAAEANRSDASDQRARAAFSAQYEDYAG